MEEVPQKNIAPIEISCLLKTLLLLPSKQSMKPGLYVFPLYSFQSSDSACPRQASTVQSWATSTQRQQARLIHSVANE